MKKVLFVCIHNSARSQMAEAFVNNYGNPTTSDSRFVAESAGLEPGKLNPTVVAVMKEIGIDISANPTKSVFDFYKNGRLYDYVITVCDEASGEQCPIFSGVTERLHWSFPDPSAVTGTPEEKLEKTRVIRDAIKIKVEAWLKTIR